MGDVSKICGMYPFKYILNEYGYNYSEDSLMVRLHLFGFQFGYIHKGQMVEDWISQDDDISIVGILPYSEESINCLANVRFHSAYFGSKDLAILELRRCLKDCSPIIIFLDVYELSYHPLYRRNHGQNVVMVHDYDETTGMFEIEDNHVPTMPVSWHRGWITEQELTCSILIDNPSQSQKTGLILHEHNKHLNNSQEPGLIECIRRNLLLYKGEEVGNSGIAGLNNFDRKFREIIMNYPVADLMPIMRSIYLHMTGRAGMVLSRKRLGSLLEEVGIESDYSKISKLWQELAGIIIRISIAYKESYVEKAIDKLHQLVEAERQEVDICIKKLN